MNPYPLGLRLAGRRVLVVGGGAVASRRIPALLDAGADVVVVAPHVTPAVHGLADAGRLHWTARGFQPSDVDGAWLIHVAVDDAQVAAAVSEAAEQRRVFCIRADDRHAATAWTPATTRHGPVTVAVTAGGDFRRSMAVRDVIRTLLEGSPVDVGLDRAPGGVKLRGVALVGGGPGDPELITVRGRRLVAAADVVVVDRLAPGLLLDELRADVEVVDASKIPYGPARTQQEINSLLVEHARAGRFVVRLKGGDPFVFGRGGEEVLACADAGIPVTIVPGVTSAVAAPAMAGIPVTHRGVAHEVVVVTGHLAPGDPASLVDWPVVARLRGTVCILMGLTHLRSIAETLVGHGRPGDTPVAVVQEATTAAQRALRTTLARVADDVAGSGVRPPAVVVVGAVVDALVDAVVDGAGRFGDWDKPSGKTSTA
jgi:uroporphyrin-III C-methyltransferase / precorrin-2 dehydrogenase / sirohydrochlorin ferrochelatase